MYLFIFKIPSSETQNHIENQTTSGLSSTPNDTENQTSSVPSEVVENNSSTDKESCRQYDLNKLLKIIAELKEEIKAKVTKFVKFVKFVIPNNFNLF